MNGKSVVPGWYEVSFDGDGHFTRVLIKRADEYGIVWGWDEEDDPELLSTEQMEWRGTVVREIEP